MYGAYVQHPVLIHNQDIQGCLSSIINESATCNASVYT